MALSRASGVLFALGLGATSCGAGGSYGEVSPHWEHLDGHEVYVVPDPRDTGQDRTSRVRLTNLEELRGYTLDLINGLRRFRRRSALELDPALNTFAQKASIRLSVEHRPHGHFETEGRACGCGAHAENQGSPHG